MLSHERIVICVSVAEAGRYAMLALDWDHYVEDIIVSGDAEEDDFVCIVYTNGLGDRLPHRAGIATYMFDALFPSEVCLANLPRLGAMMLGQLPPVVGVPPRLPPLGPPQAFFPRPPDEGVGGFVPGVFSG